MFVTLYNIYLQKAHTYTLLLEGLRVPSPVHLRNIAYMSASIPRRLAECGSCFAARGCREVTQIAGLEVTAGRVPSR